MLLLFFWVQLNSILVLKDKIRHKRTHDSEDGQVTRQEGFLGHRHRYSYPVSGNILQQVGHRSGLQTVEKGKTS